MITLPGLKIAHKLPLVIVGSALLVGLGIGVVAYGVGLQTVDMQRQQNFEASVQSGIGRVQDYIKSVSTDLKLLASRRETIAAIAAMSAAYGALDAQGDGAALVHAAFVDNDPNPKGKRQATDAAGTTVGAYDDAHRLIHPEWRAMMTARDYADVFLFNADGLLVYSVQKNDDFATGFADPASNPLADSGLGEAYRAARSASAGTVGFVDFSLYAANGKVAESFLATPVYDGTTLVGVLAFGLPAKTFTAQMATIKGLGRTGEALIVGADGLMRTQSRYSMASDVLVSSVKGDPTFDAALAGTAASGIIPNFRGYQTAVMAVPTSVYGVQWVVAAVQNQSEVLAPVVAMRNLILIIGGVLLLLAAGLGMVFSRSLSRPITRLTRSMDALAGGDLEVAVEGARRKDELGAMSRAVEVFRQNSSRVVELNAEQVAAEQSNRIERIEMMHDLQNAFGAVVDAAIAGDFSRRVEAHFPDEVLNQLAGSVNTLVHTVDRGVNETGIVLEALANTDLTKRMQGSYEGAFAKLKADTNAVAETLTGVVSQLKNTSRSLKTATQEIVLGSNDLSERTNKQAATIEQTSAAMQLLAGTVATNVQKARDASVNASAVTRTAEEGGAVMHQATQAMERITQSSGKISNIIGLIDDIAFQTNLLALNASVEAARAGEAGKGFAVVAVEVRRLAQSAANASHDIKELIDQSASEVTGGSRLVVDAATKLSDMLEAARQNNALMDVIARQSHEQATSIDEVNTAMRVLDEMTQHNAALVEQINAALEQTEAQASELDRVVDIFALQDPDAAPMLIQAAE
ncbi:methyl-accepting chemotaxis protein [uncultured Devosia sp.]|uniref:methyl-accepting chemotaxis protein n=1 Tax=uncultured Devosia sp. TaxID=211434 RepID=UPI0035CC286C